MDNLHSNTTGKDTDGLNGFLDSTNQPFQPPPSKIQLGNFVTIDELSKKFQEKSIQFGFGSDAIIESILPISGNIKRTVTLVYVTVFEFCFKNQVGKIEVFNRSLGRGWKFITAETALCLRLEYLNQGSGNVIYAPIGSLCASEGKYPVAVIENDLDILMFQGNSDDPNSILLGNNQLVFELCD